jgi:L-ascorbate metabolism protein UlaG (beta-lactamase superfamily)
VQILRIDDHQSWRIRCGRQQLLIDPWLVDDVEFGPGGRWLRRTHGAPVALRPRDVPASDLLVLTSPRPDHAHPRTLAALDRSMRVIGPPAAVRLARRLGFRSTLALAPGARIVLENEIALTAIRSALPWGASSVGLLLESLADGVRLYLESHRPPERHPLLAPPVDVVILPVRQVRALGIPVALDAEGSIAVARRLAARLLLATGTGTGAVTGPGAQLLRREGDGAAFEAQASLHLGEGRGRVLAPGASVRIGPRRRAVPAGDAVGR